MPCNLEPSEREIKLKETAVVYSYALFKLGLEVPDKVKEAAENLYCKSDYVEKLCTLIKTLTKEQRESIIYNAKNRLSRKLADWYETHLEADQKREQEEQKMKQQTELRKSAMSKLTTEERQALGFPK